MPAHRKKTNESIELVSIAQNEEQEKQNQLATSTPGNLASQPLNLATHAIPLPDLGELDYNDPAVDEGLILGDKISSHQIKVIAVATNYVNEFGKDDYYVKPVENWIAGMENQAQQRMRKFKAENSLPSVVERSRNQDNITRVLGAGNGTE